ncbi:hypothetical protein IW146_007988 [Coemansia sp. RSA 922]|nr:hypothetical protein H4S03_007410 [Coemansia sp. S3946]KAJ2048750.1 hypothetical protein GGI08_005914 [Coemansia sp. S2]KAJ2067062.1 hypothetical protein GGH13_005462 [Coemansia sp. S155-1]KAJ2105984.1 hypothetical protein IW146_007988 [Coemansia sp. RSA 922]KAJ2341368.1 hypothetical protein GGH92_005840 [Coemansia sp. RSA 2673]KAJ2419158.1 hypothetical protein GGF41_004748 [Coemansia sp. RSA 2531]
MTSIYHHPEPFTGDGNVTEWCFFMRMYINANNPNATDDQIKAALLTNLADAARTWDVLQFDAATNTIAGTAGEFATRLIARFTPFADARQAEAKLEQIEIMTTVVAYIKTFNAIVARIHNMEDRDMHRHFVRGLKKKPAICHAVDRANPPNLEEACRVALIEDVDFVATARPAHPTPRPAAAANNNAMDVDAIHTPRLNRLTEQECTYLHGINACFSCRQTGHQQCFCPMPSLQPRHSHQCQQQQPRQYYDPQIHNMEWSAMPYGYPVPHGYMPYPYMQPPHGLAPLPHQKQPQQQQQPPSALGFPEHL